VGTWAARMIHDCPRLILPWASSGQPSKSGHRPKSGRTPERDAPNPFVVGALQASQELGRDWIPLRERPYASAAQLPWCENFLLWLSRSRTGTLCQLGRQAIDADRDGAQLDAGEVGDARKKGPPRRAAKPPDARQRRRTPYGSSRADLPPGGSEN